MKTSASSLLVGFHNLVTKSIDLSWQRDGQRHLYCLREVLDDLPSNYTADIEATEETFAAAGQATALELVPGLGAGTQPACSVLRS
mmetsp:Transcript_65751/g.140660  ORF Transcript_65751/g.140660 Transcript_65751/m.140660 type:complete len:86 (-) Transcript_65751:184-441(-)